MLSEPSFPPVHGRASVSLYAAVSAVARRDADAMEMMVADLADELGDLGDVLVAVSLTTLERLEAAVHVTEQAGIGQGITAREVLAAAASYGVVDRRAVESAAWRLDAVRERDRNRIDADIVTARMIGTDIELIYGALILLTAVITIAAERIGCSARSMTSELCMAASLASC